LPVAERLKDLGATSKTVNEFALRGDITLHQVNKTWEAVRRDPTVTDPIGTLIYRLRNGSKS